MTGAALRREIKTKYEKAEGVRFFSEKALLFALLDRNGLPKDYLIRTGSAEINEDLSRALLADADRLLAGEPLQYYLGYTTFSDFDFFVSPGVLIPRPDTEVLVREAARFLPKGARFLDFCCGSGCVGVSLALTRPDLTGALYDLSENALLLSSRNVEKHALKGRLSVERLDVLTPAADEVIRVVKPALVTANPPYLTDEEMTKLPENVRREPPEALSGGADGLLFYRRFADLCRSCLVPFLVEIGCSQASAVFDILASHNLRGNLFRDEGGRDRAILFYPA